MSAPGAGAQAEDARALELAERLAAVQERIRVASTAAMRPQPRLVVVTKFFPASDVRVLAGLGVLDVGENRDQEAAAKAAELEDLALRWHFVGQLQTKKARSVARYASAVHSVDRVPLVGALDRAVAQERERRRTEGLADRAALACFLQFALDDDAAPGGRGGASLQEAEVLAEAVLASEVLDLAGVMAVAPREMPPAVAFERLMHISATVRTVEPGATAVSAGMSGDLEEAVAAGATHLRIGSDVLGPRPVVG
ncbi:alanine racemase [Arthrobacter sp. RIT-PI-e]|uniref:YggS family pyridoxal phosphate enzyme n=1 Tax=Arthrobacter sp. RIT-PI-e TaxID=1681197 RepID=UPI000675D647|nr:alanine racemase [Arthrobacter sp. RIT-PI-e]KNC17680.1 alanine racemase [Arthrobacter sp. RIT-PI-e]